MRTEFVSLLKKLQNILYRPFTKFLGALTIFRTPLFRLSGAAFLLFSALSVCAGAPIDAERAAELKITAIGTRLAGTSQIPAFSVDVRTGLDLGPGDHAFAELPILPRTIHAKSLTWIHVTGYGWLLIPKGWQVVDGGAGADGSMALIAQSKSGTSWLEYTDAGDCVGCAIGAASCYYPQAYKQAVENEFDFSACGKASVTTAAAQRAPELQYQTQNTNGVSIQTLRNYRDLDGIRYQELLLHQANASGAEKINLKIGALGIFFKRVWVAAE